MTVTTSTIEPEKKVIFVTNDRRLDFDAKITYILADGTSIIQRVPIHSLISVSHYCTRVASLSRDTPISPNDLDGMIDETIKFYKKLGIKVKNVLVEWVN